MTINIHQSWARSRKFRRVFKHNFSQIMKLIHLHRCHPVEFDLKTTYAHIRGAGLRLISLKYHPHQIFVYWPRMAPTQYRESKAIRAFDLSKDDSYNPPDLSEGEETDASGELEDDTNLDIATFGDADGEEQELQAQMR